MTLETLDCDGPMGDFTVHFNILMALLVIYNHPLRMTHLIRRVAKIIKKWNKNPNKFNVFFLNLKMKTQISLMRLMK